MVLTEKIKREIYKAADKSKDPESFVKIAFRLVDLYDEGQYTEDEVIERLCN